MDEGRGTRWGPVGRVRLRGGGRVVVSGTIEHGPGLVGLIRGAVYDGRHPRRVP